MDPPTRYPFLVRFFASERMKRLERRAKGKPESSLVSSSRVTYRVVARDMERVGREDCEITNFKRINLIVQNGKVIEAFIG